MTTKTNAVSSASRPSWFWITASLGLAWNIFGLVQFAGSLTSTPDSLMEAGLTAEQAAVMKGYPIWMTIAFAVGTVGGTVGSCLLLLRSSYAVRTFWISLIAYVVLYVGDYTEGVFAALGAPQVIILTTVVAIAVALLAIAKRFSYPSLSLQESSTLEQV